MLTFGIKLITKLEKLSIGAVNPTAMYQYLQLME